MPQHRRDQAVEAIASAAIRRCRSTRTNNRSMGEPQGALAIPRAATVYLEHVATLANGRLILPVREAVAVFSARRRLLLRLRLRIFARALTSVKKLRMALEAQPVATSSQPTNGRFAPEPAVDPEPYFHRQTIQTKGHAGITPHGLCETVPLGPPEIPSRDA